MTVLLLVLSSTCWKKMPTKQEIMYRVNANHDGKLVIGEIIDDNANFMTFYGQRFGMLCTVKVYKHKLAGSETHEVKILRNLKRLSESKRKNPLAPEIYDDLLIHGYQVIIMEPGMPFEIIRKHGLDTDNVCFFKDLIKSLKDFHEVGSKMKRNNPKMHKMNFFMLKIHISMIKFNTEGRLMISDYFSARSKITNSVGMNLKSFVKNLEIKQFGEYSWESRIKYAFYKERNDLRTVIKFLAGNNKSAVLDCIYIQCRLIKKI